MSLCVADPRFVGVHLIPESDNPEDDKIYLLFKENAMDGEHAGKATHARIGQLCKVRAHTHINTHATCPFKHAQRNRRTQKGETHTPTLCEMASVSGKTLDGCLSGFHNGRFQGLLSVIIFSLEKSGLCCVRVQSAPEDRNLREMLNVTRT